MFDESLEEILNVLQRVIDGVDGFMQTELIGTEHWNQGYVMLSSEAIKDARKLLTKYDR